MQMEFPGLVVQIDKFLFQSKRKYNRGRLRLGDCKSEEKFDEDEESSNEDDFINNRITDNEFKGH